MIWRIEVVDEKKRPLLRPRGIEKRSRFDPKRPRNYSRRERSKDRFLPKTNESIMRMHA
jgi:hypothetical protein